jgi:hypothetical protein
MPMNFIPAVPRKVYYVVIENGDPYDILFTSYEQAVATVKIRHREEIYEESACEVNVEENPSGKTYLYVEKGIHIYVHRFKV